MKTYTLTLENGVEVSCLESGSSDQSILMIHGNSLSKETFKEQFHSSLTDQYRMIAVDLPGHGETTGDSNGSEGYSIRGLADFIISLITELKLKSVVILGHSLGGHLAIQAASEIPELKGIFAVGTPPLTPKENELSPFLDHPSLPLAFTPELSDEDVRNLSEVYWSENTTVSNVIGEGIKKSDPKFRADMGADVAQGNLKDETEVIAKLTFPVGLAVGDLDQLINRDYMENVLDSDELWRGGVQGIEGSGHTPQMEVPESFNQLIAEYASDIFG
jgi:pimeloyl-ACP methyl ester carboxylesterase